MKLLIVDDEKLTRSGLIAAIDKASLQIDTVLEAANGKEGLRIAKNERPDIILTDMRMPRMTGVEMASRLHELLPDSAFIFMSGYSDREYLKAAIHLKAVSYVEKPLDMEEVNDAIRKASEQLRQNGLVRSARSARLFENESRLAELLTHASGDPLSAGVPLPENMRPEDCFTSVILQFDRNKELSVIELYRVLNEELPPFLQKMKLNEIHFMKEDRCLCLFLYGTRPSRKDLLRFPETLQKLLSGWMPFSTALGDSGQGIANAYHSYASAVILLQGAFFCPPGSVLANTEDTPPAPPIIDDCSIEYLTALMTENREMCGKLLDQLHSCFAPPCRLLPSQAKEMYYRLFEQLQKAAKEAHLSSFPSNAEQSVWEMVEKADSLDTLHRQLEAATEHFFKDLSSRDTGSSIVFSIKEFIRQNYRNESLSIKSVSDHVKRSAPYVCTFFKAETGMTLNQYITDYRIERAREMLSDPRFKITDIAQQVGYTDVNYFGKIFKKVVGVSPSEYRGSK